MSARAYLIRLALLIVVFVVVIPGVVVGLLYLMETSPGWRNAGIGFGYVAFFLGIPIWILSFAVACWWTASRRARAVGFPFWVALSLFVFVAADWRLIFSLFQEHFRGWFLYGAAVLLLSLSLLPDRSSDGETPQAPRVAFLAATAAVGVGALLACAVLIASLTYSFTLDSRAHRVDWHARDLASWWFFVLGGAMIWAIVDGRWRRHGT
jgi:hypothetical protein